jgi:CheY-like chemotaxis protein
MTEKHYNIMLADDDADDCFFFENALGELQISSTLTIVNDGEQLMQYLTSDTKHLPDILFLDLNMPRKSGFECLAEIKDNEKLKHLYVVVFSTSFPYNKIYEKELMNRLLNIGALYYIIKPDNLEKLKQAINQALIIVGEKILFDSHTKDSLLIQEFLS